MQTRKLCCLVFIGTNTVYLIFSSVQMLHGVRGSIPAGGECGGLHGGT